MTHKLLPGYSKANSDNLPLVDIVMVANYIAKDGNYISPEIANVKAIRNGRESYGESAIGHVQVKRIGDIYSVICGVAPEHNVTSKSYKVELKVDAQKCTITSLKCSDCVASAGGCKHELALLGWIHRRGEEPTPTEVLCYWKKSTLSKVGSTIKFIEASQIRASKKRGRERLRLSKTTPKGSFFREIIDHIEVKKMKWEEEISVPEMYKHFSDEAHRFHSLDLHCLAVKFQVRNPSSTDVEAFLTFCSGEMKTNMCLKAQLETEDQSANNIWTKLR